MAQVLTSNTGGITSLPDNASIPISDKPNTIGRLNGGNPVGVMLNWNGVLTECSLEPTSGSFKGYGKLSFPVEEVTVNFSQDIVQHKRPNVPGARVESTGFNPITFKVKAPFLFGLQRGSGETWDDLYPTTFSKVFQVLTDQVAPVCTFTHPTMGQFTVKPQSGQTSATSSIRNGQILEFELIQANEDDTNVSNITQTVEFGQAQSAATIFDNTIVQLSPPPPAAITAISLTKLLQEVRGAIDSTTLLINRVTNIVNGALHQIDMIKSALYRLKTAATSGLIFQLERVRAGVYSLVHNTPTNFPTRGIPINARLAAAVQRTQGVNSAKTPINNSGNSNLAVYVVPHDMTLANIALITHDTIDQLIKLNPALSKSPTVAVGTQIVYQVVNNPSPKQ